MQETELSWGNQGSAAREQGKDGKKNSEKAEKIQGQH